MNNTECHHHKFYFLIFFVFPSIPLCSVCGTGVSSQEAKESGQTWGPSHPSRVVNFDHGDHFRCHLLKYEWNSLSRLLNSQQRHLQRVSPVRLKDYYTTCWQQKQRQQSINDKLVIPTLTKSTFWYGSFGKWERKPFLHGLYALNINVVVNKNKFTLNISTQP